MLSDNKYVTICDLVEACSDAPQFVHVPLIEIRDFLESVYNDRTFYGDGRMVRTAAPDKLVRAMNDGFIREPLFDLKGALALLVNKFGRTCFICYATERTVGRPISITEYPPDLIPSNALKIITHAHKGRVAEYVMRGNKDVLSGGLDAIDGAEVIFPKPFCTGCHSHFAGRMTHVLVGPRNERNDIEFTHALTNMMKSANFMERVRSNSQNMKKHRFSISRL